MKHLPTVRRRLLGAMLIVSMIPLILSSLILVQVFRMNSERREAQDADSVQNNIESSFTDFYLHLESATEELRGALSDLLTAPSETSDIAAYTTIYNALRSVRAYSAANVYDADGKLLYSTESAPYASQLPVNWGILYAAASSPEDIVQRSGQGEDGSAPAFSLAACIADSGGARTGYVVLNVYPVQLDGLLEDRLGSRDVLVILNPYWRTVYSTAPEVSESFVSGFRASLFDSGSIDRSDGNDSYQIWEDDGSGFIFLLRQPLVVSSETIRSLYFIAAVCAVGGFAVAIWLSLLLSRAVTRPLDHLQNAFDRVGKNELDTRLDDYSTREFSRLSDGFNHMVAALQSNQTELLENERALNEAQVRMLQAQLNPHFLCNTLDTLKWIGKINHVEDVALISTDLADILRFCISPGEFSTLSEELSVLRRYIEIQRIRLSSRFVWEERVPQQFLNCRVPKMLLQPLVENAILHGVDALSEGRITLEAVAAPAGMLHIRITDNGPGFPAEMLGVYHGTPAPDGSHHLGMYNINTILQKHYGEGCGLLLESPEEGGASVTVILPFTEETEDAERPDRGR